MAIASTWQYRISFGNLRTGKLVGGPMAATGASWTNTLNDAGSASGITLNLADPAYRGVDVRLLTAPARTFVLIEYGPKGGEFLPVFAGPIWSQSYSRSSRKVTLGASGIRSMFDHRKIVKAQDADTGVAKTNVNFPQINYAEAGIDIVRQAMTATGADLPIVTPSVASGGTHDFQWFGWELQWAGDLLSDLNSRDAGPDIDFRPRRTADGSAVEWVMRIGDESTPELREDPGVSWVWDDTVKDSPVTEVTSDIDGSKIGTRVWVPGDGTESDRIVGSAQDLTLVDGGYPMLDAEDTSHTSVTVQATLDGYAAEMLKARSHTQETWKLTVRADRNPVAGAYWPGDYATVKLRNDPFLPDGVHQVRILEVSGAQDHKQSLTMAPVEGLV